MAVAARPRLMGGLAVAGFMALCAAPLLADSLLLQEERARRSADAVAAYGDLQQGDEAYHQGKFEEAMVNYAAARDKLSAGEATRELREAATERYAQAAVEHARGLRRAGDTTGALKLVESVLSPAVSPGFGPAETLREQLMDPVATNPALTPEHAQDTEQVRKLLYQAEGFLSLGQYDDASSVYERVLIVDPTNTAARRGMEKLNGLRSDYYRAAYDEARSRMLADVDAAWELAANPEVDVAALQPTEQIEAAGEGIWAKLDNIVIENVVLDRVGLREAVDYLRQYAFDLDSTATSEDDRGVDFVIDLGGNVEQARKIENTRFDLSLRRVPLTKLLEYITAATGTQFTLEQFAVVIRPVGAVDDRIFTRTFRVPPDFLSREAVNRQVVDEDPFADESETTSGLLGTKLTARNFLEEQGVDFPEGASAVHQATSGTLTVRNTLANLDFIAQIVDSINSAEPVVVIVEATFLNIAEEVIDELGYDWLLSPVGGNEYFVGGGTVGTGQQVNDFGVFGANQNPITSGLRNGSRTELTSSIDKEIARIKSPGGAVSSGNLEDLRAPGVMNVTGIFDDFAVSAMMRGLANSGADDRMIRKTVITRSGQAATVEATRRFIYPTEYEPPEMPNSVGGAQAVNFLTGETASAGSIIATPATPTAFDVKKVGCVLDVEPLVGPDKRYIELAVRPVVVEFDGFIDYGTPLTGGSSSIDLDVLFSGQSGFSSGNFGEITANNILQPVFSVTQANTNLVLRDGATVVMGGMLQTTRQKYEDKVPVLGDLPLVGRYFTSESESSVSTALVILLKVRLVDPAGQPFRDN